MSTVLCSICDLGACRSIFGQGSSLVYKSRCCQRIKRLALSMCQEALSLRLPSSHLNASCAILQRVILSLVFDGIRCVGVFGVANVSFERRRISRNGSLVKFDDSIDGLLASVTRSPHWCWSPSRRVLAPWGLELELINVFVSGIMRSVLEVPWKSTVWCMLK